MVSTSTGHHDHAVEEETRQQRQRLYDRSRQGHAAGFDQEMVDRVAAAFQFEQRRRHGPAAKAATDAAAGNADQVVAAGHDQVGIDRQRTELVDQHGKTAAAGVAQEMIDQRRLAGAEISANQRDRDQCSAHMVSAAKMRPPCTVPQILTSPSLSPPISVGSSSSTAKSAALPTSIEPTSLSRPSV